MLIENMASSVMTIIMLIVTIAIINSDYVDGDYPIMIALTVDNGEIILWWPSSS